MPKKHKELLALLIKIRSHLQSYPGANDEVFRKQLDLAIEELQNQGDDLEKAKILMCISRIAKAIPSIVDLINRHWK